MILEGQFTIPAAQARVWDAIWDIPTLASWVPGCTSAEQLDPTTYRAHLEQQVGFLKASFDLLLKVVETEAPNRIRLHAEGEDRRIRSNVQADVQVQLEPAGDETRFRYRHDISVFGRLGALGFPLIQRKAKEIEAEFARRASASLAADESSSRAAAPDSAAPDGAAPDDAAPDGAAPPDAAGTRGA